MKIRIIQIAERGIANQERLHLSILVDTNLVNYVVFDTVKLGNAIVNAPKHTYWFLDKPVKAGDNVILYSRGGTPTENKRKDGGTDHFLYWNISQPLWGAPNSCAVVLEINDWATSPTP